MREDANVLQSVQSTSSDTTENATQSASAYLVLHHLSHLYRSGILNKTLYSDNIFFGWLGM